jgi:hypothetical protein
MGLVGAAFIGGTAALGFLLAAEVVAATAAVSEAALVYVARHRNLMISLLMIAVQAALTVALILAARAAGLAEIYQAAGAALALGLALGLSSVLKSRLLCGLLGAPVQGWRWPLIWAAAAAIVLGQLIILLPEWLELGLGIPAILAVFGWVIWKKGFGPDDRLLFKMRKKDIEVDLPAPGTTGDVVR